MKNIIKINEFNLQKKESIRRSQFIMAIWETIRPKHLPPDPRLRDANETQVFP